MPANRLGLASLRGAPSLQGTRPARPRGSSHLSYPILSTRNDVVQEILGAVAYQNNECFSLKPEDPEKFGVLMVCVFEDGDQNSATNPFCSSRSIADRHLSTIVPGYVVPLPGAFAIDHAILYLLLNNEKGNSRCKDNPFRLPEKRPDPTGTSQGS